MNHVMTAAVLTKFGGPAVLELHHDWPRPRPKSQQVLVKVTAAAVNNTDIWGSPDTSVGQFRPGRAGRCPPRVSRARAMRASGDLNPNAILVIRRILVLVDSIRPLDRLCSIAARIRERCLTMLFCSFTNEGIRQRRAQLIHRSRASTAASWGIAKTTRRPSLSR